MNTTLLDLNSLPNKAPTFDLVELFEAGCHFGHQVDKWNPKMKRFIYGEKGKVHIFDLEKTASQLTLAYNAAYELGRLGKTLIVVATKRPFREMIVNECETNGVMCISSRWLGGLLTNWEQVKKSLKRMLEIERGLETPCRRARRPRLRSRPGNRRGAGARPGLQFLRYSNGTGRYGRP